MLNRDQQIEYLNKEKEALISHLRVFLRKKTGSDLHRYRVACKRINMLIRLNRKACGNQEIQAHFSPVKDLFRISGKIREVQMHSRLLSEVHPQPMPLIQKLQELEHRQIQLLQRSGIKQLSTTSLSLGKIQHQLKKVKEKEIIRLIRKEIKRIDAELDPEISAEELHEVRKRIKFLVYLCDLTKTPEIHRNYLHLCEELIGEWHDVNLLMSWLKTNRAAPQLIRYFDDKEQNLLRKMAKVMHNFLKKVQ